LLDRVMPRPLDLCSELLESPQPLVGRPEAPWIGRLLPQELQLQGTLLGRQPNLLILQLEAQQAECTRLLRRQAKPVRIPQDRIDQRSSSRASRRTGGLDAANVNLGKGGWTVKAQREQCQHSDDSGIDRVPRSAAQ